MQFDSTDLVTLKNFDNLAITDAIAIWSKYLQRNDLPLTTEYNKDALLTWLKKHVKLDVTFQYIQEDDIDGLGLCSLWNAYCLDNNLTELVFANPNPNESPWVSIVDDKVEFANYSDELMDLGKLTEWVVLKNKTDLMFGFSHKKKSHLLQQMYALIDSY